MTAVWFSYPPHYDALAKSFASVKRVCKTAKTALVIRSDDPLPRIEFDTIIRDDFPRNQHLTGTIATHGVIRSLSKVANLSPNGLILKIDSDMILQSAFWGELGRVFRRPNGSIVGLYAIPAKCLPSLADKITPGLFNMPKEAITIGRHAMTYGTPVDDIPTGIPDCVRFIPYSAT